MSSEIKTISKREVRNGDILFFRPSSFFGHGIAFYDAVIHLFKPKMFWRIITNKGFSHVGSVLKAPDGTRKRFDACEGMLTGFREEYGQCWVFRLKLDEKQKKKFRKHLLSREGSHYDTKGIGNFIFPHFVQENEFQDFCSELIKNGLVLTGNFDDLSGVQPTPLQLYTLLRERMTFIGLLI